MPQPTNAQVHVDAPLTNVSVAYIQDADMFVAGKVFPFVPVDKKSDVYFTYTKNDWFRDEAKPRAAGEESAGSGYNLSTASYKCEVYAFHKDVDEQTDANADAPIDMFRDATKFCTQKLLLRQELQWATDFFTTGIWNTDSTPGTLWSDPNSNPIGDVRTGVSSILSVTGFMPNTLVLGFQVFIQLIDHPDVIDRIKYGSNASAPAIANEEALAKIFGVDRVLVAKSIKATNIENETSAYAYVHGKNALLCYSNPSPGIMAPSAGYSFMWTGVSNGLGKNVGISRIPMPWLGLKTQRVEGQVAFANKVVAADLGYFFSACVA